MFKVLRPIKTLLLIIVFMVLAVVASVNFNTNEEQKSEMKKGLLWQAGDKMITTLFSGLNMISSFTLSDKVGEKMEAGNKGNFVTDIWQDFKNKVSNISLTSFFSNFKKEKFNLEIKDEVKEEFVNIFNEAENTINKKVNRKSED